MQTPVKNEPGDETVNEVAEYNTTTAVKVSSGAFGRLVRTVVVSDECHQIRGIY